ncbi:PREDICTED: MPN domain-containing protein-like [Amphimedon queenslandica]|uniref:MPN domain-containing protein n=1 Tax=Amphimedon queenslandica TaxID=400682 RepID=A0A1X7UH33_AMPQE|nr:PREDICTED: MPN domain-containing protein-like [Amphimedon queenslandica]|eukprot:XP_019854291.1 PREDICTED: MPN domain-containing protein-like [Amphimedon queenslandica]
MAVAGRSISMFSLITDNILEPGDEVLTFDYLGKRYTADLLPEGTIRGNGQIYASPYAWASYCKNEINPDQKTAIGWGHIRYRGIKLSQYKNLYLKKHKLCSDQDEVPSDSSRSFGIRKGRRKKVPPDSNTLAEPPPAITRDTIGVLAGGTSSGLLGDHVGVAVQEAQHQQAALSETSELVQCASFKTLGEVQPFQVVVSSNVLLLMDYHSHLCWSEVLGYLGGLYDPVQKAIQVVQAFPVCHNPSDSSDVNARTEAAIKEKMVSDGLRVVGWYHSHPSSEATPSVNDVTQQLLYQETVSTSEGEEPCVGFIIGPNLANRRAEIQSNISMFWVKRRDKMHASPLSVSYTTAWEQYLTQSVADEMNRISTFYRHRQDSINFKAQWKEGVPFAHKLKTSLANVQPEFPHENSESFFTFIEQLLFRT